MDHAGWRDARQPALQFDCEPHFNPAFQQSAVTPFALRPSTIRSTPQSGTPARSAIAAMTNSRSLALSAISMMASLSFLSPCRRNARSFGVSNRPFPFSSGADQPTPDELEEDWGDEVSGDVPRAA